MDFLPNQRLLKYTKVCPKTGKFPGFKTPRGWARLWLPIMGIGSILWIAWRIATKPSRITYPCMKVAIPFASGYLSYLLSMVTSVFFIRKLRSKVQEARYGSAILIAIPCGIFLLWLAASFELPTFATHRYESQTLAANAPIGDAQGIFPGRVVWEHDPDATDEDCTLEVGDGYFLAENTDVTVVNNMVTRAVIALTGEANVKDAWNALFVSFNEKHGKGSVGYQEGERIFIKTNFVGTVTINQDYEISSVDYKAARTTPQAIKAILKHLVDDVDIPQENIAVGDPIGHFGKELFEQLYPDYPSVQYIDHRGDKGRTYAEPGNNADIFYSDRGAILRTGDSDSWQNAQYGDPVTQDTLYKVIEHADYLINMAIFKAHARAGVTFCAKNHFGSHVRPRAKQLHMGLINPNGVPDDPVARFGYDKYRVIVDLMGHRMLGGNTVLFMVDALWGSMSGGHPDKFQSPPFNGDWTSSVFMSQDQVALESVCLDFLRAEAEFNEDAASYPLMDGVDDYLRQAADPTYWPEGIQYDPENDGTPISSLGVFEHWNNATDRQYTRNLGSGDGIELYQPADQTVPVELASFSGRIVNDRIMLNWTTYSESVNYGFEVQCRDNGAPFKSIGFVKGTGNSSIPKSYLYEDSRRLPAGKLQYRLKQIDLDGSFEYSSIIAVDVAAPEDFTVFQNYPNPFNPDTEIRFHLPTTSNVSLTIFNSRGQLIRNLSIGMYPAGHHNVEWDGKDEEGQDVVSGLYFYKITVGHTSSVKKMSLVR